jgi:hypothetical protein
MIVPNVTVDLKSSRAVSVTLEEDVSMIREIQLRMRSWQNYVANRSRMALTKVKAERCRRRYQERTENAGAQLDQRNNLVDRDIRASIVRSRGFSQFHAHQGDVRPDADRAHRVFDGHAPISIGHRALLEENGRSLCAEVVKEILHDERPNRSPQAGQAINRFKAGRLRSTMRLAVGRAITDWFSNCVSVRETVSMVRPR